MECWTHDIDLESLSIEELEDLCISRGFELVKEIDPDTGSPKEFSKDEYVEAARQCLEIEAEMEELLQKHPELLEEIQAETEKMKLEQDKLEKELSDMKQLFNDTQKERGLKDEYENIFDESSQTEMDDEKQIEVIDAWLKSHGLNNYGDPEGVMYTGGTPLFDERTGESISRLNYILEKFPEKPWTKDEHDQDHSTHSYVPPEDIESNENKNKSDISEEVNESNKERVFAHDKSSEQISTKDDEFLSLDDILGQFKKKILHDLNQVVDLVLPQQWREPLIQTIKPMVRIIRQAVLTMYEMVKRYTGVILKEIKDRTDENKHNEESKAIETEH
jgi:hypothetical protein